MSQSYLNSQSNIRLDYLESIINPDITTDYLINNANIYSNGQIIKTNGYYSKGDSGGAFWQKTVTVSTPSQSPSDFLDGKLTDPDGYEWVILTQSIVYPYQFGFLTDTATSSNTNAFKAAIKVALSSTKYLQLIEGRHELTEQIDIDDRVTLAGTSRQDTQILFSGSPTKTAQTYKAWKTEYDSGNFAVSDDAAIAAGFKITGAQVHFQDLRISGNSEYNVSTPVVTPITSYPLTPDFDCGVLQQVTDFSMARVVIDGDWGLGGLYIDGSQPTGNTANDRGKYSNCKFYGRYGLRIEGAYGQPISGDNYQDLVANDTRGAGGISDLGFYNCQFYDENTQVNTDLGDRYVRQSDGGALFIHGQLYPNTSKRIQGIRFYNCRAASYKNEFIFKSNYCNRVEFHGIHTERVSVASYDTDGTTPLNDSDFSLTTTQNSQNIKFFGGEKSGESDNMTYSDGSNTLISMFSWDDGSTSSESLVSNNIKDKGSWTPVVAGASVAGSQTYSNQTGSYTRIGNIVFAHCRISLSSFDVATSGDIQIRGLPYASRSGSGQETAGSVGFYTNLNLDAGYSQLCCAVDDGNDYLDLWQAGDNIGAQKIESSDITNTTGLFLSIIYETTEPAGL